MSSSAASGTGSGGFASGGGGGGGGRGFTSGTIQTRSIAETREQMQKIVYQFKEQKKAVADVRTLLSLNWVGEGRNEFEAQYNLLISKVSDIGDTLDEMYKALVEAEAKYQEADDTYHQEMIMGLEANGFQVDGQSRTILSGDRMSSDDKKAQDSSHE